MPFLEGHGLAALNTRAESDLEEGDKRLISLDIALLESALEASFGPQDRCVFRREWTAEEERGLELFDELLDHKPSYYTINPYKEFGLAERVMLVRHT